MEKKLRPEKIVVKPMRHSESNRLTPNYEEHELDADDLV